MEHSCVGGKVDAAPSYEQRIVGMRTRIYHLIHRRLGNVADAQDLTQETLFRAWKSSLERPPTGCFESWVLKIAANQVNDYGRRRLRRPQMSLSTLLNDSEEGEASGYELADSENDPAQRLLRCAIDERLEVCLSRLLPRERNLVWLMAAGLNSQEIAVLLHCPAGAVRHRVHRMRQRLRQEEPEPI